MMSGQEYENMAVVGQVADVVHAFKEAASYLKRIKDRRRTRPPPRGLVVDSKALNDLEFSLSRGQDVIRTQYERDFRRMGISFATGDIQAIEQLRDILGELQRGVVAALKFSYQHDQHVEFQPLQDISDYCQDQAAMALMQLNQRLIMNADVNAMATGNPYGTAPSYFPTADQSRPSRNLPRTRTADPLPQIPLPSPDTAVRLPTPEHSPPLQEPDYGKMQSNRNNPFRPRPPILNSKASQNSLKALLTPPLEQSPGPPPTAPLPPTPRDYEKKRREQKTQPGSSKIDRLTGSTPSERGFDEVWNEKNSWRTQSAARQFEFREPHPGTPVDPSRIDEPESSPTQAGIPMAISTSPRDLRAFPSPPTRMRPLMSTSPPQASSKLYPPEVENRGSVSTLASQTPSTDASFLSRQTSVTSSYRSSNPISNEPPQSAGSIHVTTGISIRSGPANIPAPIHEMSAQSDPEAPISPPLHPDSFPLPSRNLSIFPPRAPDQVPQAPMVRRTSQVSAGSGRSETSSSQAPAPMPVRTVPPQSLDPSNAKANLPSKDNKYGTLCKAAFKAQVGDLTKAYSAERRPGGLTSSRVVDYMKCKSCDFSGQVSLNAKGQRVPDRKIIMTKGTGVAYRWDFLFKSHLPVRNGVTSKDAEFGCMFCCAEGRGTPVYKGMNSFIAHVAEHRPGVAGLANNNDLRVPDGIVCDRMDALVGRIMEVEDRWEVAFPAASGDGAYSDTVGGHNDARSIRSAAPSRMR